MSRLTWVAVWMLAAMGLGSSALAQSQAEIAAKSNEEGKELMFAGKFAEASAKFQDAVSRVPEAKYFFNLCTSRFQEGKFDEAMQACRAVDGNSPTPDQRAKTDKLMAKIEEEAKKQGIELRPVGGGGGDPNLCATNPNDPSCRPAQPSVCTTNPQDPSCAAPAQGAVGRPPSEGVFTSTSPDNKYTWTLGLDLYGGGGQIGRKDYYGKAAAGFRIKGDYMMVPASRIGAQIYFGLTHFQARKASLNLADQLDIFDIGVAGYKHLCLPSTQRVCLTPLVGIQLALMSPADDMNDTGSQVFNYAAVGGRGELAAQFALGSRYEHVLSAMVGVNVYSAVFADPTEGRTRAEVGLDKPGAAAYLGLGYTYRFNTPLGSTPLITLE
jgi:hypothetical protein